MDGNSRPQILGSFFLSVNIGVKKNVKFSTENILNYIYPRRPGKDGSQLYPSLLNLNPMVQVEISQLTAECNDWRNALRQYREEFSSDKNKLQEAASRSLSKDQLQKVEHLHNQFHIQLINIHDLKHAIKSHCRTIDLEMSGARGQVREETLADHENLFGQYQSLDATLQELRDEFSRFMERSS